ncbi:MULTISPECIES: hypothetical protein [Streptomyces]|uniref:hypothetical protein n=1 Tax=Streptomyces sp. SYP-A7185 TaxID=3040076 RepID=UPI0038F685FD
MNQPRHTDGRPLLAVQAEDGPTDPTHAYGAFPSLGEIGRLIVSTATQNLAHTGLRTAEERRPQARDATAPRSH